MSVAVTVTSPPTPAPPRVVVTGLPAIKAVSLGSEFSSCTELTRIRSGANYDGGRSTRDGNSGNAGGTSGSGGADGVAKVKDLSLSIGRARLDGAVVNAVAEIVILAQAGNIGLAAAQLCGLSKHAGDAELLWKSAWKLKSSVVVYLHRMVAGNQCRCPGQRRGWPGQQRESQLRTSY